MDLQLPTVLAEHMLTRYIGHLMRLHLTVADTTLQGGGGRARREREGRREGGRGGREGEGGRGREGGRESCQFLKQRHS